MCISNPFVLQVELWQFCKTKTCNELNPLNYVYSSNYLPKKEILKIEILKSEYLKSTPYCIIFYGERPKLAFVVLDRQSGLHL